MRNWFYTIIAIAGALSLVLAGIAVALIPWLSAIREPLVAFIQNDQLVMSLSGCALALIGLFFIAFLAMRQKRRYYYVQSGNSSVKVHEAVVQDYLYEYLQELFPKSEIPLKLLVKRRKLFIAADLPYVSASEQGPLITKINEEIGELLATKLGYTHPFRLSISFATQKPEEP